MWSCTVFVSDGADVADLRVDEEEEKSSASFFAERPLGMAAMFSFCASMMSKLTISLDAILSDIGIARLPECRWSSCEWPESKGVEVLVLLSLKSRTLPFCC